MVLLNSAKHAERAYKRHRHISGLIDVILVHLQCYGIQGQIFPEWLSSIIPDITGQAKRFKMFCDLSRFFTQSILSLHTAETFFSYSVESVESNCTVKENGVALLLPNNHVPSSRG